MNPKRLHALCMTLFIMLPISLSMADYHYASHTGSDEYPYTSWETAADSIQPAINAGSPGDTTFVGSGQWEVAVACSLHEGISLVGMGIDSTTIIRLVPRGDIIRPFGHNVISSFTLEGNGTDLDSWVRAMLPVYTNEVEIINSRFINLYCGIGGEFTGKIENCLFRNDAYGIDGSFDACSLLVKNNTFVASTRLSLWGASGIWRPLRWTVVNNIFYGNSAYSEPGAVGVIGFNSYRLPDSVYIANNLVYHHNIPGAEYIGWLGRAWLEGNTLFDSLSNCMAVAVDSFAGLSDEVLRNNAIAGFEYALVTGDDGMRLRLHYNSFWNNTHIQSIRWDGDVPPDTVVGNLFSDPMFVNPDSGNFHLQAFSPCIDAGDPAVLDIDGTRSDIGCYGGPYGASYSYMDLVPRTPDSLSARISGDSLIITWRQNTEADFYRYMVNRDTISGFTPWAGNIVSEPETSLFVDFNWDRQHNYYYLIAAYDNQLNLSPYSEELAVVNVGVFDEQLLTPRISYIEKNYPNPFNEQTIINYHLANLGYQPAAVQLTICDIGGRLIKILVNQRQYPGDYRISWDGRDEGGEAVTSGVYFARLIVSGIELQRAQKIVLLK